MKLYDIQGGKVVIHADLLGLPKFKELYEKDQPLAVKQISYIVLKNIVDSPYSGMLESDREQWIKKDLFGDRDWQPTQDVLDAEEQFINIYYDSLSARLLRGARRRLEAVIKFYEDSLEDDSMDDAKADKIIAAIGKLDKTSSSLYQLERSVKMEEMESSKVRGGGKINPYELSKR